MYILPVPKELVIKEQKFTIQYNHPIVVNSFCKMDVNHYARLLQNSIKENVGYSLQIMRGNKVDKSIYLTINESLKAEEYHLTVSEAGIEIQGGDEAAILYGVQTLRQILIQEGAVLSCLEIIDHPTIAHRGFYHDVTRGRIPTLAYLKTFADQLSYYKMNQLQLYVEHSFLFQDLSEMWRDDTPLTAEEIMELDEYCRKLNIELVPSLSTFGHLFKLLSSKTYGHLRELEDYKPAEFSYLDRMRHHTIDVSNKESLSLMNKMIEEFIPLFSSNHFNIGADETFDLGKGKSKQLGEVIGMKNMYIDYVKELCEFIISKGKRPMFWGDVICGFPEAIKRLPKEVICLNWGYAPDQREEETILLYNAGATQYLCPGVGGWNQFINLIHSSYLNITRMCGYAHKYNVLGILNTDWGDFGHINHPEFSTAGMIYGACFSWNEHILSFEEVNKQISMLEYKDASETFLSTVSGMPEHSIFAWERVVLFKEEHSKKEIEEQKQSFLETDFTKVESANAALSELRDKLYQTISSMGNNKKHVVKAYLVASEGMYLFNTIGATIAAYKFGLETSAKKDPNKLAESLERWFYYFKEIWRATSKESELFRIQEVINWYGDYLRDLNV